ncbi:MAG: hypothetical protein QM742_12805 [Aquabacterium sp.]
MYYVLRDASGQISSLHRDPVIGAQVLPADHPEVRQFMGDGNESRQYATLDAGFLRVLEDLIDALIRRNVLCITDLPMEAQLKLFDRKHFREGVQSHSLDLYEPGSAPRVHESNVVIADWQELPSETTSE